MRVCGSIPSATKTPVTNTVTGGSFVYVKVASTSQNRCSYGVNTRRAVKNEAIMPPQRSPRRIRSFLSSVSWARRSFSVIVVSPPHEWFYRRRPASDCVSAKLVTPGFCPRWSAGRYHAYPQPCGHIVGCALPQSCQNDDTLSRVSVLACQASWQPSPSHHKVTIFVPLKRASYVRIILTVAVYVSSWHIHLA